MAVRAAQQAIELEPSLGLAHAALGYAWSQEGALLRGEEEYRKALALGQPAGELAAYSVLLLAVGNIDKARASFRAGRETDPLNPVIVAFSVGTHHLAGDTRAAMAEYERGRVAHSNWPLGDFVAIVVRLGSGQVRSPAELPLDAGGIDKAAMDYFHEPERALEELRILYANEQYADQIARRRVAVWAAYFGDPELALRAMTDSATASTLNGFVLWFPVFSEVRQLPGFKDLMHKLGLVSYWRVYGWPEHCRPTRGEDFECS
jgi:tetratricopeptide (TPR) repeat protein